MAITYTGIHYNCYLWSSPLSQPHRVWTSHVGLHEQCMAKVDIFPRSSSTLGEGGGRVAACLLGQCQLLVHCRHHLSTFSRLCIDILCKLYSQQLVKCRRARHSHDWQLTSGEGCCCQLTGLCCNTIIRLWRCLPLSTRRRAVYTNATYQIPHADIQCAIDMIYIIIYIIIHGVSF